jgi:hypothetical protein
LGLLNIVVLQYLTLAIGNVNANLEFPLHSSAPPYVIPSELMRLAILAMLLAAGLDAAVVRGLVVEHQTGRPLARALVVLQPIAGTNGATQSVHSDNYGAFEFASMPGGAYLVIALRRSFAPTQYGQKQWKSSGVPVVMEENATTFLTLRMQRFGAITGTIVDENDVGLQEHDVVAYRNSRPPVLVARGKTDDRGVYRIWGLEPGSYFVRTVGKQYDEGSYLPTFSKETARLEEAHPVEVQLDLDTTDVNVRPAPGRLFSIAGRAITYPQAQVTLTLVSDIGSESTTSDQQGNFKFNPTAPGPYELYATAQTDRRFPSGNINAAYQYLYLERDEPDRRIALGAIPDLRLAIEDVKGQAIDPRTVQILVRRKDLSGEGKTETLRTGQGKLALAPGRWDLALAPSPTYYAASFSGPKSDNTQRGRADGWNEITLATGPGVSDVTFVLSPRPGTLHGVAKNSAHDLVEGVPVFLEAYDVEARRRIADVRMTRTDTRGQFEFYGLAPGQYRVLSTFEFRAPDSSQLDAANARVIKVDEAQDQTLELDLYIIR